MNGLSLPGTPIARRCRPYERWAVRVLCCLLLSLGLPWSAGGGESEPESEAEAGKKETADEKARRGVFERHVAAGRSAFGERKFAEALTHFRNALALYPEDHYAGLLAGVSAYWNREADVALKYWAPVAKAAMKNSPLEWMVTRHLVLAWHGAGKDAQAEQCVQRLYEMRSQTRLPQIVKAQGFTRQHIWLGRRRVGIWEVFDERGELPRVWEYEVAEAEGKGENVVVRLAVELEPRPDGKAGYVLVERAARRRVYKRWPVKPKYLEARGLALTAIKAHLKYLDGGTNVAGAAEKPATKTAVDSEKPETRKPPETEEGKRELTPGERERLKKVVALRLPPAATRILATASRLTDVDFMISRYVRLSVSDQAAARRFEAEHLTRRFPHATSDATELVQHVASSSAQDCAEAFRHVGTAVTGGKAHYAHYVLLTGLNTRGGEPPAEYLAVCLGSTDFVVRDTAALLLARAGQKQGLEALFKELASVGDGREADEVSRVVSFYLEELIGPVLGPCPLKDGVPWREAALAWWKEHNADLGYARNTPPGQAIWRVTK